MNETVKVYSFPGLRCKYGLFSRLLIDVEDGIGIEACGFGAEATRVGELVFNTAMTGYLESLTDPSYKGQILVEAHPHIGNYGVLSRSRTLYGIPLDYESDRIQVEGLVVAELPAHSHHSMVTSLHSWLASEGIPGLYRTDTRFIIKVLREYGVSMAVIATSEKDKLPEWSELQSIIKASSSYEEKPYALMVTPRKPITHKPGGSVRARIAILDCGIKYGILRELLKRGLEVTRFPCNVKPDVMIENYDGVLLSNGPGNPAILKKQAETAAVLYTYEKPILAICLGAQLLALGLGANTYKLPYGHRAVNKPVVELDTGRCMITTHNHGYAVDKESLRGTGLKPWFIQPDDGTLEGFRSNDGQVLAVQFHPEAGPGTWDSTWIFDLFLKLVEA